MNFKEYEVEVEIRYKKTYYIEADDVDSAMENAEEEALMDDYDPYDADCEITVLDVS